MLCSRKDLECFYREVDRRSLKGKMGTNNINLQVDFQQSVESESPYNVDNLLQQKDMVNKFPPSCDESKFPSTLHPLLNFPLSVEESDKSPYEGDIKESKTFRSDCFPNQNCKHTRLLLNSVGNLLYFGESSPLSLLHECRFIFTNVIGISKFTDDPLRESIIDEPHEAKIRNPFQLPRRKLCDILVKFFKENINDTFYIFDMKYFNETIINKVYDNPIRAKQSHMCLLHLVFAIGALFAEISPSYKIHDLDVASSAELLDSSSSFMRSSVSDFRLWMVEANFLRYFYYQTSTKLSYSWIYLGIAIRLAQALGIHKKVINKKFNDLLYALHRRRLWRSLFICDRVSSINLGRPLMINNYDRDDQDIDLIFNPEDKFRLKCQAEISKIAQIHCKIVETIFQDGMINLNQANQLATELKEWSLNLPDELNLSSTLQVFKYGDKSNNNLLLTVHMSQFYGIMLLCRPFLMYIIMRNLKALTNDELPFNSILLNFCKGCIKSAFFDN